MTEPRTASAPSCGADIRERRTVEQTAAHDISISLRSRRRHQRGGALRSNEGKILTCFPWWRRTPSISRSCWRIALFIGLEREEHKQRESTYALGGATTFPIVGLVSYSLALVSRRRSQCMDRGLRRLERLRLAVLPAQARARAGRGHHHGDVGARHVRGGGAGPAGTLLDCHDDRRAHSARSGR